MKFLWINGTFVPADQAILRAGDLAVHRGYGIFDFFKFVEDTPLLWDHYLQRFAASAQGLGLTMEYSMDELKQVILELFSKNREFNCGIKLTLTGGYAADGYTPEQSNLLITQHEILTPSPEKYKSGFKVVTYQYQRELPEFKTINYLRGIYLQPKLRELQVDDVLYYSQGQVTEFPRSNFFIVNKQGEVLTPASNILKGITRETVFKICPHPIRAQDLTVEAVMDAKEAFLTSTTKRIMPIVEIDGKSLGTGVPGPITLQLAKELEILEFKKPCVLPLLGQ